MIKVKQTGNASDAGFQSMGEENMRRISEKTARALCGMYPMPDMGREVCVAFASDKEWPTFKHRLSVQNISGLFFLACSSVSVDAWPDVFKVEVIA